ncbi:hypothetical protein QL093DRAFT_1103936 [Fusarium oxysporum]|nr:hypothetical protein QL093DRAFT_1103936 [Fusarium oxysporum]
MEPFRPKPSKETFRCKAIACMNRRWQRGWMKEGENVNDSLTTRFICKISGCSRIRRINRIFWKCLDQKLEKIKGNGSFNAGLGATVGQ